MRQIRPTLEAFYELKKHWGVSAAALIRRAHDFGVIGEATYRRLYKGLSVTGTRKKEPNEIPQSPPTLLSQAAAQSPGIAATLCERLGMRGLELETLLQAKLPSG
jgi:Zn-dependent peptidase ImmA (M78 family)